MMVLGIDEVGRGCWAGPLCVGAVVFEEKTRLRGLTDSKKLTSAQREALIPRIKTKSYFVGLGWVSAQELDAIGMTKALKLATKRALIGCSVPVQKIIIDGNVAFVKDPRVELLPKADEKIQAVSAASVIAKVARDRYMRLKSKQFPNYVFEQHVGYGTKQHQATLHQFGPCELHRKSFSPIQELLSSVA